MRARRDALTRDLIARIEQMRTTSPPDALRCRDVAPSRVASATDAVDGTWEWSVTREDSSTRATRRRSRPARRTRRLIFRKGRFELRNLGSGDVLTGDFRLVGDRLVAHLDGARPTDPILQYTWSSSADG